MPLRVLFFGTPLFAVPTLRALIDSPHEVTGVVTQPDRPRGRGQKVLPGPVKVTSLEAGLPVLQPDRLRDEHTLGMLRETASDLAVVAAYGKILPERLIAIPRLGTINVHASLLPRWRGAAPVHRAILAGDTLTGVTIMRVVKALDAGPMLAREATPIEPHETSADVDARLALLGARLLIATVDRLSAGPMPEEPQDESQATYAPKLERHEGRVDWSRPASVVHNQVRGLHPWPLAAAMLRGNRMLLLRSEVVNERASGAEPGTIVAVTPDALEIATKPGAIRLLQIQAAGRAPMSVAAFLRGHALRPGERFDPLPDGAPDEPRA